MSSEKSLDVTDSILPQEYVSVLEGQVKRNEAKVSFGSLYRFATPLETLILAVGLFMAVVHGVALPMFAFVVGSLTNNFKDFVTGSLSQSDDFMSSIRQNALYFVYIGIGIIFSSLFEAVILVRMGELMADRYRKAFLKATLAQNIAYFDDLGIGEITTKLINDTTAIQDAISEKFGKTIAGVATFITSLIVAFVTQWKLTLILLGGSIYIILVMVSTGIFLTKYVIKSEAVYAQGSSIVEDTISGIRNTFAFGLQDTMSKSFGVILDQSRVYNNHKNQAMAAMFGLLYAAFFWNYALTFWQGSRMIVWGEVDIGQIFVVMNTVFLGSYTLGQIAPNFQFIAKGLAACASLNQTIDREPTIKSSGNNLRPESVHGLIKFDNVVFRYPTRPDVPVLEDFSLEIHQGETVALVGPSGSGKSTVIGILERFYNILDGRVTLDGTPIEELDLLWLRQQIGLVSQEPTLFPTSVYENIKFGLIGSEWEHSSDETKHELVVAACKQANAWDFISSLSLGLETHVGDRGALLSGGQKQRIAIARAIVSNPKILLLDEATSALDTKSEGVVQEALDRVSKSRTTIVIAHRLSTIRNADKIVVMSKGVIVEQGTHNNLIKTRGQYYEFVEAQSIKESLHLGHTLDDPATGSTVSPGGDLKGILPEKTEEVSFTPIAEESADPSKVDPELPDGPSLFKTVRVLWLLNKPEKPQLLLGMVSAVFLGIGFPAIAVILGKICQSIMVPEAEYPHMRSEINMLAGVLFAGGWEQCLSSLAMVLLLSHAGEGLLKRVRLTLFERYLRMDASFFDDERHSAGALTAVVARDGKAIEGLGGSVLGQILNSITMVTAGVILGIAFNWRLGLVGFACVPVLVISGYMRVRVLQILTDQRQSTYEASGSIAAQYVTAVRTVQTLTLETGAQDKYNKLVDEQAKKSIMFIVRSSCVYGFTEGVTPLIMALVFWYGGKLLNEEKIGIMAFFVVFIGVIECAEGAGSIFTFAPDMAKARSSAANVVRALEAKPIVDTKSNDGIPVEHDTLQGHLRFENVSFGYPSRPGKLVLSDVSFEANKGQLIALVGASGSGKSTSIGLLERFYDPIKGKITLDGVDIRKLNINQYRSNLALVQQEPMLYAGSIRENILMGVPDQSKATQEDVEAAAKQANIHEFVSSLPEGYNTSVGTKGSMLSGGQKQRIAIARALIRDPRVLLLDEATSALDSESERIVQAALDEASRGRTTIAVAHRLSSIQKADLICVFEGGAIVERGTHHSLLACNGRYADLVRLQSLESN